jgi:hypothetical protein
MQAGVKIVMAGLVPAIHVPVTGAADSGNGVDTRVKPAHDGLRFALHHDGASRVGC